MYHGNPACLSRATPASRRPAPMLGALAVVLLLTGCATPPKIYTNQDPSADLAGYRTFGFPERPDTDPDGYSSLVSLHLQNAVAAQLEARGLTRSDSPDLLANFSVETTDRISGTQAGPSVGGGVGMGRRTSGFGVSLGYGFGGGGYREGTITIDLVDTKRNQVVWQGVLVEKVKDMGEDQLQAHMTQAVGLIFEKFPVN